MYLYLLLYNKSFELMFYMFFVCGDYNESSSIDMSTCVQWFPVRCNQRAQVKYHTNLLAKIKVITKEISYLWFQKVINDTTDIAIIIGNLS